MNSPRQFTVYFDGSCAVCSREIAFYQRRAGADVICFADISRVRGGFVAPDLSREEAMAVLHVRDEQGRLVSGVDAFLALWHRLPGLRWMAFFGGLPGLRQILELGYAAFLRWRARDLSQRCAGGQCAVAQSTREG